MLSTLEPESAYIAFNLNLVSELAPLHIGTVGGHVHGFGLNKIEDTVIMGRTSNRGKAVQVEHIRLTPR